MTAPEYNLIDSPWIPVLQRDGRQVEVSLRTALAQSNEFSQVVGEVPTQVFAIHRLLLAILHRALEGPRDVEDWVSIVDSWPEQTGVVQEYLDRFHERFFLFHQTTPFFQVADLHTARGEVSGLDKMIADVPNGEHFFTTRLGSGLRRLSPAEAARWLVHLHSFDPSGIRSGAVGDPRVKQGKGYPIGPGWGGQIGGVLLVGTTLQQTLQLNLIAFAALDIHQDSDDLPPWERPPLTAAPDGDREPRGPVDLYTWQARRVRLVGDGGGVTGLVLAQGDRLQPQNRHDREPMTAWRYSEPQSKKWHTTVYMPRLHDPERSLWRGLNALLPRVEFPGAGPKPFLPPAVVRWAELIATKVPEALVDGIRLRAIGMTYGSQNSTVAEIVDDVLALPVVTVGRQADEFDALAVQAVENAEKAVRAVADFAQNLALAKGMDPKLDVRDRTRELAYSVLDPAFREWLSSLGEQEPPDVAATRWQVTVHVQVSLVGDDLLHNCPPSAWTGRTVRGRGPARHVDLAQADVWFRAQLAKALPRAGARYADTATEEAHRA